MAADFRTRRDTIIASVAGLSGQTDDILRGVTERRDSMNGARETIEAAILFIQRAATNAQTTNDLFTTILNEIEGQVGATTREQVERYAAIRDILNSDITPADFNILIAQLRDLLAQQPGGAQQPPGGAQQPPGGAQQPPRGAPPGGARAQPPAGRFGPGGAWPEAPLMGGSGRTSRFNIGGFSYPGSPGRSKRSARKTHRRKKHNKNSVRK